MKNLSKTLSLDREDVSETQRELFLKDFKKLAEEYFESGSAPSLEVTRSDDGFLLCVIWTARRVKNARRIP